MGHLCRTKVKLFFNSELSRLRKVMWMKDNNSQNALASLSYEATPTGNTTSLGY